MISSRLLGSQLAANNGFIISHSQFTVMNDDVIPAVSPLLDLQPGTLTLSVHDHDRDGL